jgi:hypothetical protein
MVLYITITNHFVGMEQERVRERERERERDEKWKR